jgi:DNA-binding XRE family transcriptional regulator
MNDTEAAKRALIARRLKEARKLAGLSQGQVAKMLGLHRPSVSEMEAGNRRVSADELRRSSPCCMRYGGHHDYSWNRPAGFRGNATTSSRL